MTRFLSAIVVFALFTAAAAYGQGAGKIPEELYYGNSLCAKAGCHGAPDPKKKFELTDDLLTSDKVFTSRNIEALIWYERDKHKDATRVLYNDRSKKMIEILGYGKPAYESKQCLSCHGVYVDDKTPIDADTFGDAKQRVDSGVSCVSCHGATSNWINEHAKVLGTPKWHDRTREDKIDNFHMADLWSPVKRAELCFSCHIGDVAKGRVVDHQMYAAGHPPLPGIEVASFSAGMPAHWESFSEKIVRARNVDKAKDPASKRTIPGAEFLKKSYGVDADKDEMEQARMVVLTSLAALKTNVAMIVEEAKTPDDKNRTWPEFANYDCYACHHELKTAGWRLGRKIDGIPGRIMPRTWPTPLAKWAYNLPGLKADGTAPDAFKATLKNWNDAFQVTPFGDPKKVVAAGTKLIADIDLRLKELEKIDLGQAATRKAIQNLVDGAAVGEVDFEQARQIAWAARVIVHELESTKERKYAPAGSFKFAPPFEETFKSLDKNFVLTLPEGQEEIAPRILGMFLSNNADYLPGNFRKDMETLGKNLRQK